jgi:hypothetical protein
VAINVSGSERQHDGLCCLVPLSRLNDGPDCLSPTTEALSARDLQLLRNLIDRALLEVPKVEKPSVAVIEFLHPLAEFGTLIKMLKQAGSNPLSEHSISTRPSNVIHRCGVRLPPVRVGEEAADHLIGVCKRRNPPDARH